MGTLLGNKMPGLAPGTRSLEREAGNLETFLAAGKPKNGKEQAGIRSRQAAPPRGASKGPGEGVAVPSRHHQNRAFETNATPGLIPQKPAAGRAQIVQDAPSWIWPLFYTALRPPIMGGAGQGTASGRLLSFGVTGPHLRRTWNKPGQKIRPPPLFRRARRSSAPTMIRPGSGQGSRRLRTCFNRARARHQPENHPGGGGHFACAAQIQELHIMGANLFLLSALASPHRPPVSPRSPPRSGRATAWLHRSGPLRPHRGGAAAQPARDMPTLTLGRPMARPTLLRALLFKREVTFAPEGQPIRKTTMSPPPQHGETACQPAHWLPTRCRSGTRLPQAENPSLGYLQQLCGRIKTISYLYSSAKFALT